MQHKDPIQIENELAYKMLKEAANNKDIKKTLSDISLPLIDKVIKPLREEINKTQDYSKLPKEYQEALENLAAEHSSEKLQYGALMPEFKSSKDILSSATNINKLLDVQEAYLRNLDKLSTVDEMATAMKIIVELTCDYYEAPKTWHSKKFDAINSLISSSKEELDIRVYRNELNQQPKLAVTLGIGKSEEDFELKTAHGEHKVEHQVYNSGKAAFGDVSMKTRLELLCKDYDANKSEKSLQKMEYYKIPLDKSKREPIEAYAKKWETFFEKLATNPKTQEKMPLVAGVSRATTRALVCLQDLSALNKPDGSFDFNKAQIVSNCLMGFLVHAGHHSIVEVAEVYNRLLDYVAIEKLEKSGPTKAMTEKKMPYYHIGNYRSFFNKGYAHIVNHETPSSKKGPSPQ